MSITRYQKKACLQQRLAEEGTDRAPHSLLTQFER